MSEENGFRNMVSMLDYVRENQEKIVCPLCAGGMQPFVSYRGFDFNSSGRIRFVCQNKACGADFAVEATEK
jgi:hypothetical protein